MTNTSASTPLAQAERALDELLEQQEALNARLQAAGNLVQQLREEGDRATIAGRDPAEFWTDPALRAHVTTRDWNAGTGSAVMHDFILSAIASLGADEGFHTYDRALADDEITVHRIIPQLTLRQWQDIGPLHDALLRIRPALARDDGTMVVHLLEDGGGSAFGTVESVVIRDADHAHAERRYQDPISGTLASVLTALAEFHWLTPRD